MTITTTPAASATFAAATGNTVSLNKVPFMRMMGWKNAHRWLNDSDSELVAEVRRNLAELAIPEAVSGYDYVTENARGDLFARMDAVVC